MEAEIDVDELRRALKNKDIKKIRVIANKIGKGRLLIMGEAETFKVLFGRDVFEFEGFIEK